MNTNRSPSRRAGDESVVAQAQSQLQTFFDELKNGTRNYRTVASLDAQIAQEYRGRCILELLQNAHDALADGGPHDAGLISFALTTDPEPILSVGNSGRPFARRTSTRSASSRRARRTPTRAWATRALAFGAFWR